MPDTDWFIERLQSQCSEESATLFLHTLLSLRDNQGIVLFHASDIDRFTRAVFGHYMANKIGEPDDS